MYKKRTRPIQQHKEGPVIQKTKRTTTSTMDKIVDYHTKPDLKNSELPESYRRLLNLILHTSDSLIHGAQGNDKISS